MLHVFYRTIVLRNTLQILLAKLMISTDITFILHVFLAECVRFLTYLDEQASHLAIILFLSKEKQTNSGGVSLGLSLDVLIYKRYAKLKLFSGQQY